MKVFLPREFTRETMYGFVEKVLDNDMRPRDDEFDFDFTELKFIRPVGVTVLSNLIERLNKQGRKVTVTYRKPKRFQRNCPMAFLDDSMFFKRYLKKTLDDKAELRPTTLPLAQVTYERSYQYLDRVIYWLAGKLSLTTESLSELKAAMSEVFNNITDHSLEHMGCVFIQQYPKKHIVTVSISDFGVGIPTAIQRISPSADDAEALRLAVQHGFSSKSTPKNRGAGLHFLLRNVVKNNQGKVYIHSNHGILSATNTDGEIDISVEKTSGFYPGTLIEIEFRTDTIDNIVEEDFSWDDY
ncbi:ATP-binding protein [Paenibacillus sp. FSL H3-0457]|uniref:ATP-binding protein n=1 Tax=Paenibacillus sp. FSL H3-0457 TaxID=2921430 RepID=UPI0030EF3733